MKSIALVGRPNVGKSSLFNRLAKERIAITSDVSGTTRDVRYKEIDIEGRVCKIIDTGGLDTSSELFENVREKSLRAAKNADIVLFIVDGKSAPDELDRQLFYEIQSFKKPIALIINKIDNDKEIERTWDFYSFGSETIIPISVSHNRGTETLINWMLKFLPPVDDDSLQIKKDNDDFDDFFEDNEDDIQKLDITETEEEENKPIRVAIIGRVNVGKSSLLNALLKDDRAVVSSVAGTTIDPVDDVFIYNDQEIHFVDTAGLRRRGKIEGIEKYALNRTEEVLSKADIALMVIDASTPYTELDERIASLVQKFNLGCILVLNKWDNRMCEYKESIDELRYRFKFLSYAPIITVSALSKQRVHKIYDLILQVYKNYNARFSTSKLNELIKEATIKHPIPSDKGKMIKIYFATQFRTSPPSIALVMNKPKSLHFSYQRYLINQLRENMDLSGTPILLFPRPRGGFGNQEEDTE